MAIGRLSMKVGKAGKAGPHAAYIAREGQYANRLERGEKLEATEAGNMPAWAQSNPLAFWQAADAYERKNGTTYREMEIALPRELSAAQRIELVREFVRQEIGDRHAYQWALHVPTAADGGEQPHFHLMFSERQVDGIDRDPEQYFKRYNAKAPEKGGARKGYGPSAGQTLTKAERAAELKELRGRWEAMCNAHLERAGVEQRIDMRSHAERGTGLEPERKQLPSAWRGEGRAQVIEFRAARAEVAQAAAELRRAVPDTGAEIIHLEAERQRREQAQREARERAEREKAQQERQRLERMSSRELAQEIARLRPPRVIDLVERDRAVLQAEAERQALQNQHTEAGSAAARARDQAQAWREAHKVQAWFHDKGIGHAPKLRELEQQREEHRAEWQRLGQRIEEASLRVQHVRQQAHQRITAEQEPTLAKLAELEALQKEKARQEREAEAKRLQQQRIEREREEESMAALEHRLAELRAAQEADATQPEPSDDDPRWAAFERTFMHAAQFEHYLSLTVLAAPLAGLKARFAAYMDTAAEQGMTPEMFAQACAKGMAEQERRAMQEQAARDADPKQPQEDSPVSTPTP
ncbi:MobA/MobL family protein [Citrobacter freundii]|nr:MobA/MobL family protein [Morganella morganii]EKH0616867.1 MobA/MobL family protein [Salmonella enterica]ELM6927158.1 MobA/MobL family protein [Citrobacter freundii]MBJ7593161.1 MobA/MobL family protein [Aeromonas veronii]MBV0792361.1 MobA/MobL family protein [Escherichia coli]SCA38748.1 mobilization protein [Klebsiella quasipneumoniae]GHZ92028.1 Mobilization protein A [Vibrio cholerae]HBB6761233.1 MobA/MobL family protein [Citrobacter amalonaticus]HBR8101245.1 MobA/MobL family protein [